LYLQIALHQAHHFNKPIRTSLKLVDHPDEHIVARVPHVHTHYDPTWNSIDRSWLSLDNINSRQTSVLLCKLLGFDHQLSSMEKGIWSMFKRGSATMTVSTFKDNRYTRLGLSSFSHSNLLAC
jgi:hypothetical protein